MDKLATPEEIDRQHLADVEHRCNMLERSLERAEKRRLATADYMKNELYALLAEPTMTRKVLRRRIYHIWQRACAEFRG